MHAFGRDITRREVFFHVEKLTFRSSRIHGSERVDLRVDGRRVPAAKAPGFVARWDTRGVSDGPHALEARVVDEDGKTIVTESLVVHVDNELPASRRLEQDHAAGVLDEDTYLRLRVWRVESPTLLPSRYHPPASEGPTFELNRLTSCEPGTRRRHPPGEASARKCGFGVFRLKRRGE